MCSEYGRVEICAGERRQCRGELFLAQSHCLRRDLITPTSSIKRVYASSLSKNCSITWSVPIFPISLGVDEDRDWDDAVRYGFISAGGGVWYTRTLSQLKEGNRVWVNNPGAGYLGVGLVTGTVVKAVDFEVDGKYLKEHETNVDYEKAYFSDSDDDHAEYIVPIKWLNTVSTQSAVSEVGFFGNQNTVAKPKTKKWQHTVERLKSLWGIK